MSHSHTVIEPAAGLTVLVGENNCGKSAVVTALQILCRNENSTYVTRHGEKECRIIVETAEGHRVEWSRKRHGSPQYRINGKKFDRLKRSVPPELHTALRLPSVTSDKQEFDVHFGEQKKPVFLLNESGTAAAEFFASSSDAIRLVEMQNLHKQRVRDATREQTDLLKTRQQLESTVDKLAEIDQLDRSLRDAESTYDQLHELEGQLTQLRFLIDCHVDANRNLLLREARMTQLSSVGPPPQFHDCQSLARLMGELQVTRQAQMRTEKVVASLEQLPRPPVAADETSLAKLVDEFQSCLQRRDRDDNKSSLLSRLQPPPTGSDSDPLQQLVGDLRQQIKEVQRHEQTAKACHDQLVCLQADIGKWARQNAVCPTCHQPVDEDQLLGWLESSEERS